MTRSLHMIVETYQSTFLPKLRSVNILRWLFDDGGCHSASGVIILNSSLPGWHHKYRENKMLALGKTEWRWGKKRCWHEFLLTTAHILEVEFLFSHSWLTLSLLKVECNPKNNKVKFRVQARWVSSNQDSTILCCLEMAVGRALNLRSENLNLHSNSVHSHNSLGRSI